jgi:hypothetical protein
MRIQKLLRTADAVAEALARKGCAVTRIVVDGALPLIEIDRPPVDGPAMVHAIRSSGGAPRSVWVIDWRGCRIECPTRARP